MKKYIIWGIISAFTILQGQVNTEAMRSEANGDSFTNQFNMEMGYEKANTEVLELAAEYRLDYIKQENFHSFIVINLENGYEQENDSAKNIITNKGFAHLRITKDLFTNYQMEVFTQYEFNEFLLLNDRYLLGTGLRIGLQKSELSSTYIGIGLMVEKETYDLNSDDEKNLLRSTNYIKNNIILTSNIDWSNTAYFQIASADLNDYRILYDGGLDFHVNESFAFTIELKYRYDNDPQGNLGSSYIQISNGVSFNF
tara:strand:- start:24 stop:788 length:765 start_codon:yes stop_codon:yes gene_type:complete